MSAVHSKTVAFAATRLLRVLAISLVAASLATGCSPTPEALLTSAKEYLAKNDRKAALIQLENALQKNPDLLEARLLLGKTLLETGDAVRAERELTKALRLGAPPEQVVPPLARSLVALGQYKRILEEFASDDVAAPEGKAELQTAVGYAQMALGNVNAARTAFAAALSADPKHVPAHLAQARIAASSGQLSEALGIVETALTISAAFPEAWQLKGDLLLAERQIEPALNAYRKAVDAKPDFLPGHSAIVLQLIRQKKLDDAEKQLDALKRVAPKHPQTFYLQALVAYYQKQLPSAQAAIQQALAVQPDNPSSLLLAALITLDLRLFTQSETHALKALQKVPRDPLARRVLVTGYLRSNNPSKALEALKPLLADNDPNLFALAGEAHMMNGEPAEASQYFARAAALDPGNTARRTSLALSHLAKGETEKGLNELEEAAAIDTGIRADLALIAAHMQGRKFDSALAAISVLEKKQPDKALPHGLRGAALLAKGDTAGARKNFEHALALEPTYFPVAASLARLDVADKQPDAARQRFEAVLAKDPKHLYALLALAELRASSGGAVSDVVASINKAIAMHPNHPAPRLALIQYYMRTKDAKNAVHAAQEAMTAAPDQPDVMSAAARAYLAGGDLKQALAIYSRLAKLQPGSPQPYLRMAEVQLAGKNKYEALQNLRQALELKPDLVEAQSAIIALNVEEGRIQEAIAMAQQVQKQRPKQSVGYVFEGDVHASQKNLTQAVRVYKAGLDQAESSDLAVRLHRTLVVGQKRAGAEAFASTWLRDHPADNVFRWYLAEAATVGKDYGTAAQHYRKILEKNGDSAPVLNNLAWVAAQLKDPQAIDYADKANRLAPDNPIIMDTLGMLLVEKGDAVRGLDLLRKASASAPGAADIRLNLAKSLLKTGDKRAAKKELDELAKLGDKFSGQAEVARLRQEL